METRSFLLKLQQREEHQKRCGGELCKEDGRHQAVMSSLKERSTGSGFSWYSAGMMMFWCELLSA
jgi:hypothetical protein